MSPGWSAVGVCLAGYLLGSIPFGILVAAAVRGVDVRTAGSGNIGATNVARVVGVGPGLVVLVLDAGKGAAAVLLARALLPGALALQALTGLLAVVGHVAPFSLGFRGWKGVATALGVLSVLVPAAALAGVLAYGGVFALFRISSVGSLTAGAAAVAASAVWPGTWLSFGFTCVIFVLILYTHRGNIRRLLSKSEARL